MFKMIYKTPTFCKLGNMQRMNIWFSGRRFWIRSTSKSVKVSYFDDVYSNTPGVTQGAN